MYKFIPASYSFGCPSAQKVSFTVPSRRKREKIDTLINQKQTMKKEDIYSRRNNESWNVWKFEKIWRLLVRHTVRPAPRPRLISRGPSQAQPHCGSGSLRQHFGQFQSVHNLRDEVLCCGRHTRHQISPVILAVFSGFGYIRFRFYMDVVTTVLKDIGLCGIDRTARRWRLCEVQNTFSIFFINFHNERTFSLFFINFHNERKISKLFINFYHERTFSIFFQFSQWINNFQTFYQFLPWKEQFPRVLSIFTMKER